jgi:RNA polymerase sigma-70 factor (ECF subfamily)
LDWIAKPKPVDPTPESNVDELSARIHEAIDRLPPQCRAIFLLSRNEEMKYREIAEHLRISVKTVEKQMGIALEKLRNHLKPYLSREFIAPLLLGLLAYLLIKIFSPLF